MDIARYLAVIDRLCDREFPEEECRWDLGTGGPGYYTAGLETSHGMRAADAQVRERTIRDFHDRRDGLARCLDERWGEQPPWGQLTVRERWARGEEIPEPWAGLSLRTEELNVWQTERGGRWVALGVADRDPADEIQLVAAVTETDPP